MRFPEVWLTPVILPAEHALGRYDPVNNRIYFSSREFFNYDSETQYYAILHEIGHWFRENYIDRNVIRFGWNMGTSDGEEGFADVFSMFFLDKNGLRRGHPSHHAVLANALENREKIVEEFAGKISRSLSSKNECSEIRCLVLKAQTL